MNNNELDPMAQGSSNDQQNNQDHDNQWDANNNNGNNVIVSGFQTPDNKNDKDADKDSEKKDIQSETKPPVTEKNENPGTEKEYDDTDHPHEYNTPKA